ncbi:MAG: N-acetylmuramoyl-L-alanine amidase family protein [Fastidiosipilaceae bacterium]|jgi:N-acetylmuramoyl-L-alanine amidase|nr:N-acetylmuramoyl-L-alanine amidase [Clostridiaceae bacterium]
MRSKGLLRFLIVFVIILFGLAGFVGYKAGVFDDLFPDLFTRETQIVDLSESDSSNSGEADLPSPSQSDERSDLGRSNEFLAKSGVGLSLTAQQADFLPPGEVIRKWPSVNGVTEDVTGGAPKLSDFKSQANDPKPLTGAVIFLDCGHGGIDAGTVYPVYAPHEVLEKDINIEIGKRLKPMLEEMGATVIMTRDTDDFISIYYRSAMVGEYFINEAKKNVLATDPNANVSALNSYQKHFDRIYELNQDSGGGDILGGVGQSRQTRMLYDIENQFEHAIYLSLHCNFNEYYSDVGGMQVYYLDNGTLYDSVSEDVSYDMVADPLQRVYPIYQGYDDAGRQRLAELIYKETVAVVPALEVREARPILTGDYAFLRCTGIDSVLVEMGFLSNSSDRTILSAPDGQEEVARGIANGVYAYYCTGDTDDEASGEDSEAETVVEDDAG